MSIRVTAPASTANLGPGFDCLAAALSLRTSLEAREAPGGEWSVNLGHRDASLEVNPDLARSAAEAVAGRLPSLEVRIEAHVPIGRGLGSSAAVIAAGLLLGCVLEGRETDPVELLRLGTPLEGHPDNLAAALFGGLVLVLPSGEVMAFRPTASVRPLMLLPRERLPTEQARQALPTRVPHDHAAANVARASGLLALLSGGRPATNDELLACTEDLLHQPYRGPLMLQTSEAMATLRAEGVAAAVSGAGPSIVCLVVTGEEDRTRQVASGFEGWELIELGWDPEGARIEE